jgi:hypothetical protein
LNIVVVEAAIFIGAITPIRLLYLDQELIQVASIRLIPPPISLAISIRFIIISQVLCIRIPFTTGDVTASS